MEPEKESMHIGQVLRQLREKQGKKQTEVASEVGIQQSYLSRIENEVNFGSPELIIAIARFLGVQPAYSIFSVLDEGAQKQQTMFLAENITLPEDFDQNDKADVEKYIGLISAKKLVEGMSKSNDKQPSQNVPDDGYERYPDGRMTPNGYLQYDNDRRAELARQQEQEASKSKKENQTVNHQ